MTALTEHLLPYIRKTSVFSLEKKFILVSTGTWSIAMTHFSERACSMKAIGP